MGSYILAMSASFLHIVSAGRWIASMGIDRHDCESIAILPDGRFLKFRINYMGRKIPSEIWNIGVKSVSFNSIKSDVSAIITSCISECLSPNTGLRSRPTQLSGMDKIWVLSSKGIYLQLNTFKYESCKNFVSLWRRNWVTDISSLNEQNGSTNRQRLSRLRLPKLLVVISAHLRLLPHAIAEIHILMRTYTTLSRFSFPLCFRKSGPSTLNSRSDIWPALEQK